MGGGIGDFFGDVGDTLGSIYKTGEDKFLETITPGFDPIIGNPFTGDTPIITPTGNFTDETWANLSNNGLPSGVMDIWQQGNSIADIIAPMIAGGYLSSAFGGSLGTLFDSGSSVLPEVAGEYGTSALSSGAGTLGTELATSGSSLSPSAISFASESGIPAGELIAGVSNQAPNITTGAGMTSIFDVAPGATNLGTSGIGSTAASQGGLGTGFNLGTGVNTVGAYAPNIGSTAADIASTYSPSTLQTLFTPDNINKAMKIGKGIANYNETAANQRQLQNMANQQQFFQNQLRQSYENPQAYLDSVEARATRSQAAQQLARAAAQSGRRNDVGAQLRDLNTMMLGKALPAYRQGLVQAYNPSSAYTAQRAAQAQSPMGNAMYSLNTLFGGSNPVISGSDVSSAYDKLAGLFGY